MSTIFSELREAVVDRIRESEDVIGPPKIEVLSFNQSDLEERIQKSLTQAIGGESAAGVCIIVGTVGMEPGENRDEIKASIGITITENVVLNSSDNGSKQHTEDLQASVFAKLMFADDGQLAWHPTEYWSELTLRDSAIQDVGMQVTYTMTFESSARVSATPKPQPQVVI